jgi:hypothetical protein
MPSIKKITQNIWKAQLKAKKTSDEMYRMKINHQ